MTAANLWMLRQYREVRYGPDGIQPLEVARLPMKLNAGATLRSAHPGLRILLSIGIGIVFVLFQQITESGALLSSMSPAVLAWTPTGALAIATGVLIWRIRT